MHLSSFSVFSFRYIGCLLGMLVGTVSICQDDLIEKGKASMIEDSIDVISVVEPADSLSDEETLIQFEGQIVYSLVMKNKAGEMSDEEAKMFMGDEQVYTIKENKYKSEMNGMLRMTQIYLGQDTIYSQMLGAPSVYWIDATSNPDQLIDYKIERGVETIAGIKCDLLTINSQEGTTKYYYNKKYYTNAKNFKRHKYGFWDFCMEKTNAVPLKTSIESKDMFFELTAKEIKSTNIEDDVFSIPQLPREANPK